jgi:hypothetical protein
MTCCLVMVRRCYWLFSATTQQFSRAQKYLRPTKGRDESVIGHFVTDVTITVSVQSVHRQPLNIPFVALISVT